MSPDPTENAGGRSGATRDELLALVRALQERHWDDEQIDRLQEELESKTPHPEVYRLVFHSDLTPDEVVDQLLGYRPIQLGPGT